MCFEEKFCPQAYVLGDRYITILRKKKYINGKDRFQVLSQFFFGYAWLIYTGRKSKHFFVRCVVETSISIRNDGMAHVSLIGSE